MPLDIKVQPKDFENQADSLIEEHKLMSILLLAVGGLSKYDRLGKNQLPSLAYKLFILISINILYWKTMEMNFIQSPVLEKAASDGFAIGIMAVVVYFSVNFLYSTLSLIVYISGYKRDESTYCYTVMRENMVELNEIRKKIGMSKLPETTGWEFAKSILILEIISCIIMCSVQHNIAVYMNYFTLPSGLLIINMYSYLLRSVVDYVLILNVKDLRTMFTYLEHYIQVVSTEELTQDNTYKTLKPLDLKESSFLRRKYIKSLFQMYRKCVAYCATLNQLFSLQTLFSISLSFALVVIFLFMGSLCFIQKAKGRFNNVQFAMMVTDVVMMILIHLGKLFYLICVCENTAKQADKVLQLGRSLILEDKAPELTQDLYLIVNVLNVERVVFSAHGFFPIDYSLFISFIGAATTYWVIMVQFQLI